jgi:hypothetical protein
MNIEYYGLHKNNNELFDFINDNSIKEFLQSAHKAITNCEMWDWIRMSQVTSFMYDNGPEMKKIRKEMDKDPINMYHSGSSYGWIMREIEYVAKYGYIKYEEACSKRVYTSD